MIYEDDNRKIIDTETMYKCKVPGCGWIGTTEEMYYDSDCGDPDDAVYSEYCCPKCFAFYLFLDYWDKVDED